VTAPHRLVFELSDSVAPDGSPLVEIALKEPRVWGSPRQPFPYRGNEPIFLGLATVPLADAALRTVGRTLYDAVAAHPPLADTFAEALRTQPPARYPLFVEIDSASQVESLPWEALCGADGTFLGLDERWAIGRMIDAARPPAAPRDLVLPMKITAVLSALHVPADQEWQALWDSIGTVPELPVELLVLASEDDLAETIAGVTPPAGVTVTVEQVPESTEALQARIRAFNPHVLHFFCHGSAGRRQPYLQVAVRSDWVTATTHSLYLEAGQFRDLTERTSDRPWLLVLNCCESAAAGPRDNLQSLALMLVRDAALPAVVGMREPVSSIDASTFTRAFYTALLSEVDGRRAGTVPADEPLNWARYAVRARTTLLDRHQMPRTEAAESTREWTLPVVYLRPDPFVVTVPAPAPAPPAMPPMSPPPMDAGPPLPGAAAGGRPGPAPDPPGPGDDDAEAGRTDRLEADLLHGLLTRLPPDTPADLLADIQTRLIALGAAPVEPGAAAPMEPVPLAPA
jgi:CHAT domain-containing protein